MSTIEEQISEAKAEVERLQKEKRDREVLARIERNKREAKKIEKFKSDLATEHGLPMDDAFGMAWGIAWEHGHSYGLGEVELHFDGLVGLLRMIQELRQAQRESK